MALSLFRTITRRLDDKAWAVTEIYGAPHSERVGHEAALWARIPPGYSGREAPIAVQVTTDTAFFGGGGTDALTKDRIVAQFRTPTVEEYMLRYPSKGVVHGRSYHRGDKIRTDKNGLTITGIDPTDTTGRTIWQIIEGSDMARRPQTAFTVHAIVKSKSIYIDQFIDKLGKLNSTIMTKLGRFGASAKELLFFQLAFQPTQFDKNKWIVDYGFLWTGVKGKTWDTVTLARKFTKSAVDVVLFDVDGTDTGRKKQTHSLVPTSDTRYARIYDTANLSPINALCQW